MGVRYIVHNRTEIRKDEDYRWLDELLKLIELGYHVEENKEEKIVMVLEEREDI